MDKKIILITGTSSGHIQGSLFQLITTGEGQPARKDEGTTAVTAKTN